MHDAVRNVSEMAGGFIYHAKALQQRRRKRSAQRFWGGEPQAIDGDWGSVEVENVVGGTPKLPQRVDEEVGGPHLPRQRVDGINP